MKKLLGVLCVAGLLVGAASAQSDPVGRLYFDLLGNDGTEDGPRFGVTAGVNPELPVGGGRLFIYWAFGHRGGDAPLPPDHQHILGLGVDISIDGDGAIGEAFYYNPTIPPFGRVRRWNQAVPNPAGGGGGQSVAFQAASVNQIGLTNIATYENLDGQYDPNDTANGQAGFGTVLIGYVDVTGSGGNNIRFSGNGFGIAEEGGHSNDPVLFGFGDDGMPDATIVPEPASLMLLGLGVLALRRRR